jgi:hypothetical protein
MTRTPTILFCLVVSCLTTILCRGAERILLPVAPQKAVAWRYTFEKPDANWSQPEFDDSGWSQGPAGFGTSQTPGTTVGTTWSTKDIWLRTEFEFAGSSFETAAVHLYHDEDVTVFLNGRQVLQRAWFVPRYELHDVTAAVKKNLRKGRNVLAVTCHQTYGGQYIDVGVVLDPKQEIFAPARLPPIKPLFDYPVRDTSICVGGDGNYYLTGTTGHPTWWKTNEGVRVWKSADLKTWEPLGLVWKIEQGTWQKEMHGDRRALWAPDIHYLKGTFWITFCMNFRGTGLLKSTTGRAEGPYVDVHPQGPITDKIDASLFMDDDGTVYFVWQNGLIARMNDEMTGLAEEPRLLKPASHTQVGFEGAYVTKQDGKYYLICADFIRGDYHCMVAASDRVYGPYGPRYLAIPHGGHNMFFTDKEGNWWATFFGNDPRAPFRERPAILRIELDDQGRVRPKMP